MVTIKYLASVTTRVVALVVVETLMIVSARARGRATIDDAAVMTSVAAVDSVMTTLVMTSEMVTSMIGVGAHRRRRLIIIVTCDDRRLTVMSGTSDSSGLMPIRGQNRGL